MSDIRRLLASLDGLVEPGGCEDCWAYQTLSADAAHPGVFHLVVSHDDWCPRLARIRAGGQ
jgi:hypothetical protein